MVTADVIILGGGVAGLAAAGELGRRGCHVALLEARERLGGRILTLRPSGAGGPLELGAEFVHGGNAALWSLMKRHRLHTRKAPPRHWLWRDGRIERLPQVAEHIEHVTSRIDVRRMQGWSFADFMRTHQDAFPDEERQLAAGFVEGFQAAPPQRMSASAIAGETIDETEQFVLPQGYDTVVEALVSELRPERVQVWRGTIGLNVNWARGRVEVHTRDRTFAAAALVLTLPLGVWQARPSQTGAVTFEPRLRAKAHVVSRMGVSHVLRLELRFHPKRWESLLPEQLRRARRAGFGFVHAPESGVPVWWSLTGRPLLTGWAGGPTAQAMARRSREKIVDRALGSLARVLGASAASVRRALVAAETHNWSRDPFSRGAYTFTVAGYEHAAEQFRAPVRDTLFFAGEATAEGAEVGTVHGALASGLRAANEVFRALNRS